MKGPEELDNSLFHRLFRKQLPLESETTLFFLDHWGRKGFVGFKFACVAVVCIIAQIVATQKPHLARLILLVGITVVSFVVIYSLTLWMRANGLA